MKSKNIFIYSIILSAFFLGVLFTTSAIFAQNNLENIQFPVAELGNCQSREQCEAFCELEENILACVNFAEAHGLMSSREAQRVRKMMELGMTSGPGGCRGEKECKNYCDDPTHMRECIIFAKEHNLMPPEELEEAEMVLKALEKGATLPGGCTSKARCEVYCENPDNIIECVEFAEAAGFISKQEAKMIRKTGGKGPGGCRGENECENYCNSPSHMQECIEFAIEYDILPEGEKQEVIKVLAALKKGVKMPNCRSKQECDIYCSEPDHILECIEFAEAAGFVSPEEAAMIRKTGGKGPGGCIGRECETYCDDPNHMQQCMEFAIEYDLMPPEQRQDAEKMLRALQKGIGPPGGCRSEVECEAYCKDPAHIEECLNFAEAAGFMSSEEVQKARKGMEFMKTGGPGGCKSEQECRSYCEDLSHVQECLDFAVEMGEMSSEDAEFSKEMLKKGITGGPGGCRSKEECETYCKNLLHLPECIKFKKEHGLEGSEDIEELERSIREEYRP
ncbi:hypothetical protein MYX06_01060 [Patescibacteria group bacterium AH-259-L05]|nr:hypothetical protein [Patescibacteria group bacterium AH-259-L05]